jgi:hypothetical protein
MEKNELSIHDRAHAESCSLVPKRWIVMKILDLPHFARFGNSRLVKVLRHKDSRLDLWTERREGRFDAYQNGQVWDVFGKAEHIISFIGESHRFARFVGVWRVLGKTAAQPRCFNYNTLEVEGYEDLTGRLVVSWGDGTRSWAQWLHRQGNKEVAEILPKNYVKDFPGYYDVTLSYHDLCDIVSHPDANREWHRMLSAVSGVYLVLDTKTGDQYVGSAYGAGGLLSRWRAYVRDGSGGNVQLKNLIAKRERASDLRFSILRVLEPGIAKAAVLEHESLVKQKLGCRVHGLNSN